MKRIFLLLVLLTSSCLAFAVVDTAKIQSVTVPILLNEQVNPIADIAIKNSAKGAVLNRVALDLGEGRQYVERVELYYTGATSLFRSRTRSQAVQDHFTQMGGGQKVYKHPAYAVKIGQSKLLDKRCVIECQKELFVGANNIYVSVVLRSDTPLEAVVELKIGSVEVDAKQMPLAITTTSDNRYRAGVCVRNAGDDGIDSYRIPGLVKAKDGTLLSVYDIRRTTSFDLQEDVQVGLSRSVDGGRTWCAMQTIIDMRGYGVMPDSQNGVGDPAILLDERTGTLWVVAMWVYGVGGDRAWWGVKQGSEPQDEASQIVMVKSSDNGRTWSQPINVTSQVKNPDWFISLQGPGRGITLRDGTLVFAFQYVDTARMPHATIISSKDGGKTWVAGKPARSNTTEAQVVETTDGVVMLNMRDNRGGSRAVMTTTDLGQTWVEHPSSRSALRESVCMASIIEVEWKGKRALLFSNPDTTAGRSRITIKSSIDDGLTWSKGLLLDEEPTWGYSCMSLVDKNSVGILYEGSRAQMTFQKILLQELF